MKKIILTSLMVSLSLFASQSKESFEAGKKIYENTCISCHGVDGEAKTSMHFVVKPRALTKSILTPEESYKIIRDGAQYWGARSDMMPSFKSVLSNKEIADVNYYISEAFNKQRDERVNKLLDESAKLTPQQEAKMLKVGGKIFKRNCAMCHGINGNGESEYVEMSKNEETFLYPYNLQKTLLTEEEIFLYSKFGGHHWGTHKKDMPSWKRKYNDVVLKSVAKYVEEKIKKK